MRILAITPGQGFDPVAWSRVLACGADAFLVREYALSAKVLLEALRWCRREAPPSMDLWVAGRLDAALAAGCGLHAPEAYPPVDPALLPLSRPLHAEGQWESRRGCFQLLVGPVFPTPGKGDPWGPERLLRWLDGLPPEGPSLLALGGVAASRMAGIRHPRLEGVALIRGLWQAEDPRRAVEELRAAWA
ncbi:MAG: thiamine phosphate synthase [Acidobacteria bacterium]|nr:thiamine phosphate synthase [Acidobacteriota bacterium]